MACEQTVVCIEAETKKHKWRYLSRHQKLCNDVLLQELRKETLCFMLVSMPRTLPMPNSVSSFQHVEGSYMQQRTDMTITKITEPRLSADCSRLL